MDVGGSPKRCPKCAGAMEAGFLRDRQQGRFSKAGEWVQGDPEYSLLGNLKTRSKTRYRVRAFRCEKCGYLEQYAVGLPLSDWG